MERPRDFAHLNGDKLVLRFGLTGVLQSMCILEVGRYCRLYRDGAELRARFTDRDDVIVDRFPTDTLAENALGIASDALRVQQPTKTAPSSRWKRWLPWVIAPILVLAALEAFYFYMVSASEEVSNTPPLAAASQWKAGTVQVPEEPAPAPRSMREPVLEPARLAELLGAAVTKEKYSLVYSSNDGQGAEQTLYVFSDPNCIYCRRFESQLKTLSQKYTVHLFPVSVVGEELSLRIGEQVLCLPPAERVSWWQKTLQGIAMPAKSTTEECRLAVGDNDQVFRALQFRGTPTIVSGMGRELPEWIPHTAEALDAWMQAGSGQ